MAMMADPPSDGNSFNNLLDSVSKAPPSTSLVLNPNTPDTPGTNYTAQMGDAMLMESLVGVGAAQKMLDIQKDWPISDGKSAELFIQAYANQKNNAFLQLAAFLPNETATQQTFTKETSTATFHLDFLGALFKGFSLGTAAMGEIDNILTNVTASLANLSLESSSESMTMDHLLTIYFFEDVAGLDGVKVVKMRNMYMHVDQASFQWASGKSSGTTFTFHMSYFDSTFGVNTELITSNRAKIVETITKAGVSNMGDMLQKANAHMIDSSH